MSLSAGVSFLLVFDFGEGNNLKELDVYCFHKVHKVTVFCMHVFQELNCQKYNLLCGDALLQ